MQVTEMVEVESDSTPVYVPNAMLLAVTRQVDSTVALTVVVVVLLAAVAGTAMARGKPNENTTPDSAHGKRNQYDISCFP